MEIDFIKTSDSDLASVLYCLGFPIDGIHYTGTGDTMEYYFKDGERLQRAMLDYQMKKLRMEPKELFETRREVIARVKKEYAASANKFKKN